MTSPFIFVHPGAPEPEPPPPGSQIGRHFLANPEDIAGPLAEAAVELAGVEPPPGFQRLNLWLILEIVRDLQAKRTMMPPGHDPLTLVYRSSGKCLGPAPMVERLWLDYGRTEIAPGSYLSIDLLPHESEVAHGQYRGRPDPLDAARVDARALAFWFTDGDGRRCWQAGTPWPEEPTEPDESEAVPLDRKVIRAIVRLTLDKDFPAGIELFFDPYDACCLGGIVVDRPHQTLVKVSTDDDPDELKERLRRLRVMPDGRVIG
jgi:hypothetical protein